MAIRYTKSYNKEIRQAVKHFNTVRNTLSKRGIKLTPAPLKVSELKARYQTRRELNKELTLLNKVSSSDDRLLKEVETSGGATAVKWQFDYLKLNQKKAIEHFENEKEIELKRTPMFPGERMRLDAIEQKLQYLNMDLEYMNQEQFRSYQSAISEYMATPAKIKGGYRGFLTEVVNVMRLCGYSEDTINNLFKQLKTLAPSEFHELYETSDLIRRVYELADSPTYENGIKLNTDVDDAKDNIIDPLLSRIKYDIQKVKNK